MLTTRPLRWLRSSSSASPTCLVTPVIKYTMDYRKHKGYAPPQQLLLSGRFFLLCILCRKKLFAILSFDHIFFKFVIWFLFSCFQLNYHEIQICLSKFAKVYLVSHIKILKFINFLSLFNWKQTNILNFCSMHCIWGYIIRYFLNNIKILI